jgi:C4-dicarboxylate transporter DctM subunit
MSGSSAAATATCGRLLLPPLQRQGYARPFAAGVVAASAGIDVVIPPSIAMILYGVTAEQSIPRLFLAGIVPGLLLAGFMAAFILAHALLTGIKAEGGFSLARAARATLNCLWALGMPAIVFGGIYGGVFSPTEAAGIACVYAMLVVGLVYREIGAFEILLSAGRSMVLTAQVFIIVAAGGVFSWLLTVNNVPQSLVAWVLALKFEPWMVLMAINILLLIVGMFLDTASSILVLTPLLAPVAKAIGVDPVHFGVIVVMNLSIGTFTPPFGINLFVGQAVFRLPMSVMYPAVVPFIIASVIALLLVTYIPQLSLVTLRLL